MKNKRLVIKEEMKPYIIEKYDEYYNSINSNKTVKDIGLELNQLFKDMFKKDYDFDESAYRKVYNAYKDGFNQGLTLSSTEEELKRLANARNKIKFEKIMFQTEKTEVNKQIREFARENLIVNKIVNEIRNLKPLKIPKVINKVNDKKVGILCFGDEHYGVEFEIKGLFNETLNKYNVEIFTNRMEQLMLKTIEIVKKEKIEKIYVYSMGDFADGILRTSQLMKLKFGVVESTIQYMNYICDWLNRLSNHVEIEYQMTNGNHTELRMLGEPKGTFTDDNMGKVVSEMIKTRLENNKNFKIVENPTGMIYSSVFDYNILGIHGEVKSMEKAIKDISSIYDIKINILIAGHLHHTNHENVGQDRDVINVPSIMGIDDYSIQLNKTANSGATFLVLEPSGISCQYNIKLN